MNYRVIHNNIKVLDIIEATGITITNNEIVEGTLNEIYQTISNLNLTNVPSISSFNP